VFESCSMHEGVQKSICMMVVEGAKKNFDWKLLYGTDFYIVYSIIYVYNLLHSSYNTKHTGTVYILDQGRKEGRNKSYVYTQKNYNVGRYNF